MEFFIALVIVIIGIGSFLWGYLCAKRECRMENKKPEKAPVKFKYVNANVFPVHVVREVSKYDLECMAPEGLFSLERMVAPIMKRDLGEALWQYAKLETKKRPDESLLCKATVNVCFDPVGDEYE